MQLEVYRSYATREQDETSYTEGEQFVGSEPARYRARGVEETKKRPEAL
jgi:hypothetical protein